MKITSVETTIVRVPFTHGDTGSAGRAGNLRLSTMNTLLVRVETDAGLVGWGEGFGFNLVDATRTAVDTVIAPLCVGHDAQDIAGLNALLTRRLHNYGRNGPASFGIAGVDIALWDIAGKIAGKPLHRLLGEGNRERVPSYSSLLRYGDAEIVARNVERAVSQGFPAIKLHEIDPMIIRAARAAAPADIPIFVDVNCPWSPEEAIAFAKGMQGCDLGWLEEPVWPPENISGLAQIAKGSQIPIAAGENIVTLFEYQTMFALGAVHYAQPSVTKVGLSMMRAIGAEAAKHGVRLAPHSPYFGPGLLATVHIAAAAAETMAVERYGCDLEADLFEGAIEPKNGWITVPQGPGLGLEPSVDVIARFG